MKKLRILALAVLLVALYALCGCDMIVAPPSQEPSEPPVNTTHHCEYKYVPDASYPSTCTAFGKDVYKCSCGNVKEEIVQMIGHNVETIPAKPATCTEDGATEGKWCTVCNTVLVQNEVIKSEGHSVVIDPATDAVGNTPAKTEGKHCSVCGLVIVKQEFIFVSDYSKPENYDSSYALDYLKSLPKGSAYAEFYSRLDEEADYFHMGSGDLAPDLIVAGIKYSDLGISAEEAIAVWVAYKSDRPLYYWISDGISYTDTHLNLIAHEEYKLGLVRNGMNSAIYDKVEEYMASVSASSTYHIALTFHDLIIGGGYYRYEADGVTPSDDASAHNVVGMLLEGSGVCESYAKSFQLLLNYCDVENVIITGYAGEPHAWNTVKLDDGRWYLCDLTWDDEPDFMLGISHRYFMVTESEDLSGQDGPWINSALPFALSHTPSYPSMSGTSFAYTTPVVSDIPYSNADFELRREYNLEGLVYSIVGYNTAALVRIEKDGEIIVPETVLINGAEYTVIAVGAMENGYFKTKSIAVEYDKAPSYPQRNITSITLPVSVIFIWDNAFLLDSLIDINVDPDNPAFESKDGVLFTKGLKVLVKYPSGRSATEYTLPDATEYIAEGAFSMFYSNVTLKLEAIYLGDSFILAGFANRGYGYDKYDETYNAVPGEMDKIKGFLSGSKTVE